MPQALTNVTARELLAMPREGRRTELVRGELREMAPAGFEHGDLAMRIGESLSRHVRANKLGKVCAAKTGFLLSTDPDTVRAPDVGFVSRRRLETLGTIKGYFPGPPDLAIEGISSNDRFQEVLDKVEDWLSAGASAVVLIEPGKRRAQVYRSRTQIEALEESDTLRVEQVVSGWELPLQDLFRV